MSLVSEGAGQALVPVIKSVSELGRSYDAWLCDIWGVIHNGRIAFMDACRACAEFRAQGGTVILITNAPRPHGSVRAQLDSYDVPRASYDAIVTSGDVTTSLIKAYGGRRLYHLGPERDLAVYDGLDVSLAGLDDADGVVCTGLFDDITETPDDYQDILARAHRRGLAMICANPDLVVERGRDLVYCAGSLALAYEALGGRVDYAGKPYKPVYDLAFSLIAKARGGVLPAPNRIMVIGDGVKTDMAGAQTMGLDALFIRSGIHFSQDLELDGDALSDLFAHTDFRPVAAMTALEW